MSSAAPSASPPGILPVGAFCAAAVGSGACAASVSCVGGVAVRARVRPRVRGAAAGVRVFACVCRAVVGVAVSSVACVGVVPSPAVCALPCVFARVCVRVCAVICVWALLVAPPRAGGVSCLFPFGAEPGPRCGRTSGAHLGTSSSRDTPQVWRTLGLQRSTPLDAGESSTVKPEVFLTPPVCGLPYALHWR